MMMEPDLFQWTPPIQAPFVAGSATSAEAATKIQKAIGPLHRKLLDLLKQYPEGLTDCDMQELTDMNPSTQRPRRIELATAGKIENFGCTRPTRAGRKAIVWHLK